MGVAKTAVGIFAAVVAKEALTAAGRTNDLGEAVVATVVGSVAASTAVHLLKDDAAEIVGEITGRTPQKQLPA